MFLKKSFTAVVLILLASCAATNSGYVKHPNVTFEQGTIKTNVRSYSLFNGITCCYDVYSEIIEIDTEWPRLFLSRQPEPGFRAQKLFIPVRSVDEIISYLEFQYKLPANETAQKAIKFGGNTMRVGSDIYDGKKLIFIIDLNYNFAFEVDELPKLLEILKDYRSKFQKVKA